MFGLYCIVAKYIKNDLTFKISCRWAYMPLHVLNVVSSDSDGGDIAGPSTGQTVPGPSNALTETASSDDTDDIGDNVADTPMDVRQRESRRQRYIPESGWTKDDVTMQTITARGPDELMQLDPLPTTIVADVVNYLLNSICNADVVSVNFSMSRKPALLAKNFLDLHVLSYMDNMALQTDVADGEGVGGTCKPS